jgi:monoamine oxidase
MASGDTEVVVVGGGAAGIAAGRRLIDAGIECLVVEARPRLGGRSWTIGDGSEFPIDLGCGWLHSADRNPWREIAEAAGGTIDKTPPPWRRLSLPIGFPIAEQRGFLQALETFYERLGSLADGEPDRRPRHFSSRAAAGTT